MVLNVTTTTAALGGDSAYHFSRHLLTGAGPPAVLIVIAFFSHASLLFTLLCRAHVSVEHGPLLVLVYNR